jgi:hypothetical protein
MDFIVFAATRAEEQRGEERGGLGLFIGEDGLERGLGFRAYSDRRAGRGAVRREESGPSSEMELTGGAGVSASGERGSVPVRNEAVLGHGPLLELGCFGSPRSSPFFFILFPFLFLNSILFQNFCIFESIQFKQIPKIL